jgi:hypothetical protein
VTNWVSVASEEYAPAVFTAAGTVRYGHDSRWVTKTINGSATCTGSTFGNADPAPGLYKECQVQLSAPNVTQTGGVPVINTALLPSPMKGYSVDRITSGGGFDAGPFDIGAFRTNCGVSHFSFDDPIVYPGQSGKSHLHMFFGNTGTNANTTASTLAASGSSTCSGGTANRTGYWVPALVNLKTGAPVVPSGSIWYYKSAYYGVPAESVKPFPVGLRMIAGNSGNSTAAGASPYVRIACGASSTYGSVIPSCAVGDTVNIGIQFPQCWDGVNLDSPDHKSHMAYASNGCPSTHPVPLAEISLNLSYTVIEAGTDSNWKLSSDNYVGQGGYSMHADWFNGWKDDVMKTWVANCINRKASSSNAICDGRYLE